MTVRPAVPSALVATVCVLAAVACGGGGGSNPTTPTPPVATPPPSQAGPPATATIRITSSGVDPREVTIAVGGRVTFVNQATRNHDVSSDPHPTHTDCPPINAVNVLSPGQTRDTSAFSQARRCGFHDHNDPGNDALRGTIVIQ